MRTSRTFGVRLLTATLISVLMMGCGDKKEQVAALPTPGAPATAATAPVQVKVSTGADPDKAPSYPSIYGKPPGTN